MEYYVIVKRKRYNNTKCYRLETDKLMMEQNSPEIYLSIYDEEYQIAIVHGYY